MSVINESISMADMILSIKSTVQHIVKEEMALLGLRDDICLKEPPKTVHKPVSDRGPISRFKIQAPTTPVNPAPMENMTDDQLVDMTMAAIEAGFRQKWHRLTDLQRKDRIRRFTERHVGRLGISSENISVIYESLCVKMLVEKSIKPKDFMYDEASGELTDIPGLTYDTDTKTVAMTKAKPAIVNIAPDDKSTSSGDDDDAQDTTQPATKPKKQTPRKTPKLMKTMAKMKR